MSWLRIEADLPWNDKISGLSTDSTRWAYIKLLCIAKKHDRPDFSRAALVDLMSRHAKAIPELIKAGLLDEVEDDHGSLVVHDFTDYQRRAADAQRQRNRRDRDSGVTANGQERDIGVTSTGPKRDLQYIDRNSTVQRQYMDGDGDGDSSPPPPSLLDHLNGAAKLDPSDPVDVWEMYFGKPPTERQRDTFLASWVNTEGKPQVVELLRLAAGARASGDITASDHVGWIEAVVKERRDNRVMERSEADKRRREIVAEREEEPDEGTRIFLEASEIWRARGKDKDEFNSWRGNSTAAAAYIERWKGDTEHAPPTD